MNSGELKSLVELCKENDFNGIYQLLNEASVTKKGRLFELFLIHLFEGNGWLVKDSAGKNDKGADLVLYHPKNPSKASFIVQAKNQKSPLTFDETKIELIKFEEQARAKYRCNNYQLISINGFVKEAKKLEEFNMTIFNFEKVKTLIANYSEDRSLPSLELATHNLITIRKLREQFENNFRIAIVQATGTGKSYIIGQAINDVTPRACVVLAPSKFILDHQKNLMPWRSDVFYITYARAVNMSADEWSKINPSLIVLDEFHRAGADIWGEGVKRLLDSCGNAKVLGTTATPIRYLDRARNMVDEIFHSNLSNEISLYEAISRDILPNPKYVSALYSFNEINIEFEQAIKNSRINEGEKQKALADLNKIYIDWEESSGIPTILNKHLKNLSGKYIVFCEDINHLDQMQDEVSKWFREASKYRNKRIKRQSYLIHSENTDAENRTELSAFENSNVMSGAHILLSVNMLNEGLHLKQVNGVFFVRKTISPIIYLQQLGRCLQVNSEVEPIVFDLVTNIDNVRTVYFKDELSDAISSNNTKRSKLGLPPTKVTVNMHDEILDITLALERLSNERNLHLSSFDFWFNELESFVEEFKHARPADAYKTKDGLPLGKWVSAGRSRKKIMTAEQISKLDSLNGWVWDAVKFEWDKAYESLEKYVNKFGHARPSSHYKTEDKFGLGHWVGYQRTRKEYLKDEQILLLESLEGWTWSLDRFNWEEGVNALKEFEKEFEHVRPTKDYKTRSEYKLGYWVSQIRKRKSKLTKDQISELESLEGWTWNLSKSEWDRAVEALEKFVKEFGHARPSDGHKTKSGFALGQWVKGRRRHGKDKHSLEKTKQLESFEGWVWDIEKFKWEQGINAVKIFEKEFGHARPVKNYITEDGYKLGAWVSGRRRVKENLTTDQVSQLESLQGWTWDPIKFQWEQGLEALNKYVINNGNANPPGLFKTVDGYPLGQWVAVKRRSKEKLTNEQIFQLESIRGWLWRVKGK